MADDVLDPDAIAAANEAKIEVQRKKRRRELSDIKSLLRSAEGRRFLNRLFAVTGLFQNPFDIGGVSGMTEYRSGRQSVGQQVLHDVRLASSKEQLGDIMFLDAVTEED